MAGHAQAQPIVDSLGAAQAAGLVYVSGEGADIVRVSSGKGFRYRDSFGGWIKDAATLARIRALAIPPAWTGVRICSDPNGHIQAVGLDQRGRRQYRYHAKFREVRDGVKFEHMLVFAQSLPGLRERIAEHMAEPGLGREKVLATVVDLLETTMIRVGNTAYAKANKSYGLTTLLRRHVKVDGGQLRFHFKGKSGKVWTLDVRDRRVARIVKNCQELPGQHLFKYIDDTGQPQVVTSADINAYLEDISGADITAKDFRTWAGTVLAAMALAELGVADSQAQVKKNIARAIEQASAKLGNTPSICRKCYVHPDVLRAYSEGELRLAMDDRIHFHQGRGKLRPEEAAVFSLLHHRLERTRAA